MIWLKSWLRVLWRMIYLGYYRLKKTASIAGFNLNQDSPSDLIEQSEEVSKWNFEDLPEEMMYNILSKIPLAQRTRLEVVCKQWQLIIRDVKDQKILILSNKIMEHATESSIGNCSVPKHCTKYNAEDNVIVSSSRDISCVLERCPRLTTLFVCFDDDFVFSQKQLAQDLNKWCPLLEHIQWRKFGVETDFLNELGDFKNLSCWYVTIDEQDADNAISFFNRQRNLQLKSLYFGKGINDVLSRTNPKHLEQINVNSYTLGESEQVDINRFHQLKYFAHLFLSYENYLHLQTLTTLVWFASSRDEFLTQGIFRTIVRNNRQIQHIILNDLIDDQVIPLLAEYLPNIKTLSVSSRNASHYTNEEWLALSKLKKLEHLTLKRISTSQVDMDGLRMVLQGCSSLIFLICDHRQDANLEETVRLEIESVIYSAVEQCQLTDGHYFRRIVITSDQVKSSKLYWICRVRYYA